jgi:hypothetical protein
MSIHNIYPEFADRVLERWQKAIVGTVAGKRIDPYTENARVDFLLITKEHNFDIATRKVAFVYEDEVIELYTEREVTVFRALNKAAIENGLLKPFEDAPPEVNDTNIYTDAQLLAILNEKNMPTYKGMLKKITAIPVLDRMETLITDDHRQWVLKELIKRRDMIKNA